VRRYAWVSTSTLSVSVRHSRSTQLMYSHGIRKPAEVPLSSITVSTALYAKKSNALAAAQGRASAIGTPRFNMRFSHDL
jgi:hypothetical protein